MTTNTLTSMTLRDLLRGPVATRWHTVPTVMEQNLAEHSHQVGLIAEAMLVRFCASQYECKPSVESRYLCLKYAQLHDLPEVLLGDLPSPIKALFKQELPGFSDLLKKMEYQLIPELEELEQAMSSYPYLPFFLKAADIVEAKLFFSYAKGRDEEQTQIVSSKLDGFLQETIDKAKSWPQYSLGIEQAILDVCAEIFGTNSALIKSEASIDGSTR